VEKRSQNYIFSVLKCVQDFGSLVLSVIAFGSYVKGDLSETSDVDLLVIVSDSSPSDKIIELDRKLTEIQKHFRLGEPPKSFSAKFLNFISRQTGMFVSHFICKESSFVNLDFVQIFRTNRLLTMLLAPKGLVLSGLLDHAKTLYGKDILGKVKPIKVNSSDLLKSLLMNTMLSLGALVLSLYKPKEAIRFSMEAVKWSMYSTYYDVFHKNDNLSQIATQFINHNVASSQISRMMKLRNQIKVDRKFIFLSPVSILLIHLSCQKLNLEKEEQRSWMEILLGKVPIRRPFNCIVFVLLTYVLGITIIGFVTNFHVWENIVWYGWIGLFCFETYAVLYISDAYRNCIRDIVPKVSKPEESESFITELKNIAFTKRSLVLTIIGVPVLGGVVIFFTPIGLYHPLLSFYIDLYGAIWVGLFMSYAFWLGMAMVTSTIRFSKYADNISVDHFDPDRCGGLKPIGSLLLTGVRLWSIGTATAAVLLATKLSPFTIFVFLATMVTIGLFLLLPQYKIHLVMKRARKEQFDKTILELRDLKQQLSLTPKDGDLLLKHTREILLFNRIEKMSVWPFNTNILIGFVISFVLPLAVLLIGLFIKVPQVSLHF